MKIGLSFYYKSKKKYGSHIWNVYAVDRESSVDTCAQFHPLNNTRTVFESPMFACFIADNWLYCFQSLYTLRARDVLLRDRKQRVW